ncbi:hypothetical protein [Bifidobacterium saguinibicoloris]|uniref:hypothetical protein n=1 Tax=Bifidobacterium saguinibicoloris TaxID=2834433 RepID=UPI001C59C74D|nr:hypothetical protein [Bifidobacterium saguinibicoloris]MBW3080674.1 hypothetical protein [Bifidobacterium saguinibicoloris]
MADTTMKTQDTPDSDPTAIDGGHVALPPRWAGSLDVHTPNPADDWTRAVSMTGGATIIDEPGFNLTALLNVIAYRYEDGTNETYAELSIPSDEGRDIPVRLGYRAAACLALLTHAYEHDTPEPTREQVDELENTITGLLEGDAHAARR